MEHFTRSLEKGDFANQTKGKIMTEKEMNQISDTLLKLEANVNCGKMSPNDTAIAVHRTLDFILNIYQKGDGKNKE